MAEYNEVIKQFKRMCWYYSRDKGQKSCPMCTSYPNCNIGQCRKIAFEKPAHFAATVMRWASEHPVVYPTCEDWLQSVGVMESSDVLLRRIKGQLLIDGIPAHAIPTTKVLEPIPADLAEKLGVEPKE